MQSIITRLDLSVETEFNDGLSGGVMERLPSVIALAGPNGAGKSRLLRRVRKMAQIIPERRSRDTELATLNQQRLQRLSQSDERANKIARKMATVQSVDWDGVFESPIQVVDIDPLPRQLRSVADAKTSQVRDAGAPAPDGAFVLTEDAFWTIQSISNSYLSATHPKTKLNEIDRQWHTTRFADLNTIIRELLDTSLDPYAFDDPRLFERSLNASELSNGQQRLLAFAIAFFKAGDARTPKLVIMDEPESHLHPEAVIRVLERIKSLSGNVQIWLATHSLALLASLDPHSIWYIKSGVVSFAGNRTEDVLLSLMGGEQNIERLSTFLSSPAEFALDTFVSECVMPPAVVAPASRDPQMKEITDALCVAETRSIRVIDWGAGRGRLAATMRERQGISSENLARSVEYFAYDTSAVHREECCSAMQGLVPNPALNYFEEVSRLVAHFDVRKADVVTMCNVLHEIEPLEWTRILAEEVPSVVREEGCLLIAEDLGMPHGEHANAHGFLVLDEVGIRRLFVDEESKITVCRSPEERYKHRLITYLVPRQLLLNVRTQTVADAAKWVCDNARRRIREIRQTGAVSHRSGRELAFQLAQFANSSLVLQSIGAGLECHPSGAFGSCKDGIQR